MGEPVKWPWVRSPENHGTFTLLPGDQYVIGVPRDCPMDMAHAVVEGVRLWAAETPRRSTLVFPFPVDVVDKR